MSKLWRMLQARDEGERVILLPSFTLCERVESLPTLTMHTAYRYSLGVEIRRYVVAESSNELVCMQDDVKRAIVEELFGEFRLPLLNALNLVNNNELDAARDEINGVLRSMFQ